LGSHVSLIYRGTNPCAAFDDDMRDALVESMKQRGLEVLLGCDSPRWRSVAKPACRNQQGRCDRMPTRSCWRSAACQYPGAACRQAGVELGKRGEVTVDDYSRTSAPHIYAVGDVTDGCN